MRWFIYSIMIAVSLEASNIDINQLVQKIQKVQKNKKISQTVDYKIYDPFTKAKIILKKNNRTFVKKIKRAKPIVIQTILNNSVLIDGKWYYRGAIVYGSKIIKINANNILVKKGNKIHMIRQREKQNLLKTKEIVK